MANLTLFSAPLRGKRIYALVPGGDPLGRVRRDDPLWARPDVYTHWHHRVDEEITRVRPADVIKFWVAE